MTQVLIGLALAAGTIGYLALAYNRQKRNEYRDRVEFKRSANPLPWSGECGRTRQRAEWADRGYEE